MIATDVVITTLINDLEWQAQTNEVHTAFSTLYYYSTHIQKVLTVHDIKQMQTYFHTDTNYKNAVHIISLNNDYNKMIWWDQQRFVLT